MLVGLVSLVTAVLRPIFSKIRSEGHRNVTRDAVRLRCDGEVVVISPSSAILDNAIAVCNVISRIVSNAVRGIAEDSFDSIVGDVIGDAVDSICSDLFDGTVGNTISCAVAVHNDIAIGLQIVDVCNWRGARIDYCEIYQSAE